MKNNRIFFSSVSIPHNELIAFCETNHLELIAQSLITHEALAFDWDLKEEVVFFSSPRAVDFFLKKYPTILHSKKIACVGTGTARHLLEKGYAPNFIGENSGDTREVAIQFLHWLQDDTVFFPLAEQSFQTISSRIPESQCKTAFVYRTAHLSIQIPTCATYVFTSPSNVVAFLAKNEIPATSQVIAWGKSTERELKSNHIAVSHTLENSTISDLITVLSDK